MVYRKSVVNRHGDHYEIKLVLIFLNLTDHFNHYYMDVLYSEDFELVEPDRVRRGAPEVQGGNSNSPPSSRDW